MSVNFFKPEDFQHTFEGKPLDWAMVYKNLADFCNAKLEREGKRVYSCRNQAWMTERTSDIQFEAFILAIKEIEKKPCEHEPQLSRNNTIETVTLMCQHCGKMLKPKNGWEEA